MRDVRTTFCLSLLPISNLNECSVRILLLDNTIIVWPLKNRLQFLCRSEHRHHINEEMHHGMTVIIPIRCKMKFVQLCGLKYLLNFIPIYTPDHKCCLGRDTCSHVLHSDVIFMVSQNAFFSKSVKM